MSDRKPAKRKSGGGGGGETAVLILIGVALLVLFRNSARLAPWVTVVERAIVRLVPAAVVVGAAIVVVVVVRAVLTRRRATAARLGAVHLKALREAGLARATQDADGTPVFVKPVRVIDDDGDHTRYALPEGVSVGQVIAARERFISGLRLPVAADRVVISAYRGLAHHLLITVKPPELSLTERHPHLPAVTDWRDPVLLGRDTRTGTDITTPTWNVPAWLVGGRSGSGKSVALRLLIAHYALDPEALLWGFDAKGSTDDWGSIRPRFARWVTTSGDTAIDGQLLIQTLRELDAEVYRRNSTPGRDYPGLLVLLEEVTALRDDLSPKDRAELDGLLGRLVKMCRSANTTLVITAQRPSAKDLPTTVRAQAEVLLCMRMTRAADATMVLGEQPDHDVSSFPDGYGLVSVKGDLRPIVVDYFDDALWETLCDQWTTTPAVAVQDEGPDGVFEACVEIVRGGPQTPTALYDALPPTLRPATQRALAAILAERGWRSENNVRLEGRFVRAYRLSPRLSPRLSLVPDDPSDTAPDLRKRDIANPEDAYREDTR